MAEFSPMMQHYLEIKEQYKDCIVFYRLGDFYEMFFDEIADKKKEHLCVEFLFMLPKVIYQSL